MARESSTVKLLNTDPDSQHWKIPMIAKKCGWGGLGFVCLLDYKYIPLIKP